MYYTASKGIEKTENKSKKYIVAGIVAMLMVAATAVPALAAGPYNAITSNGSNPAFEQSGLGSIQNKNNTELRFGKGGRIAIPGEAGDHANSNSAVAPYSAGGSGGIVDPQGSF
jgi:hypothetical protein